MTIAQIQKYCLGKRSSSGDCPFGPGVMVIRVRAKMFALIPLDTQPSQINLKCDPELARILRRTYPKQVLPGYHMNKRHWNTIILDGKIPDVEVKAMIDDSYDLVAGPAQKR